MTTAQNGPNTASFTVAFFDSLGRQTWFKDESGYIVKQEYDAATSALTKIIEDVDTATTNDEPSGWSTPSGGGLHLSTTFEVDALGRETKRTDPGSTLTYTIYKDADHEVRVYPGWTGSATTGPTQVYREDRPGSYFETLTMSATPNVTDSKPTGTEAVSSLQTLSRSYVSNGGQVSYVDDYFSFASLSYSTSPNIGTENTHFYRTSFSYDKGGRLSRTLRPTGTIERTVYDGLGRPVSAWVGLDDTPTSGEWSPINRVGTDLVQVSVNTWDSGGLGQRVQSAQLVTGFADDFDRANSSSIGSSWQEQVGDLAIASNQLQGQTNPTSLATYATTLGPDVSVEATIALSGTESAGLVARWTGSGDQNMYLGQVEVASGVYTAKIRKNISGTWTDLVSIAIPTGTGTLRFDVQGSALKLYFNGAQVLSTTDGSITAAGQVGLRLGQWVEADNFRAFQLDRVTQYFYDWRGRLVVTKAGVDGGNTETVQRPITYTEYDNLNQVVAQEMYDGDSDTDPGNDSGGDGVPDKPSSSLRRARSLTNFDEEGKVFRTEVYSVNQSDGSLSTYTLKTDFWFERRGNVIKQTTPAFSSSSAVVGPAAPITKMTYDGLSRLLKTYFSDAGGDTGFSDADDVTSDNVLEQMEYQYDSNSNLIFTIAKQRFHDDANTGELGNVSTNPKSRVSYEAFYYDLANRLTNEVNAGTNAGSSYTRPSSPDSASDTKLRTDYSYNSAGWVLDVTDPRGLVFRREYDTLGRVTKTIQAYTDGTPSAGDDRTTVYTYDGSGHVLTVKADTNGTDQTTEYVYQVRTSTGSGISSNDLLSAVKHPDASTGAASSSNQDVYTVNALGQNTTWTDRNGNVHTYSYDVLGRMTKDAITTLGSGVNGAVRRLEVAFDTGGRAYLFTSYDAATGGNIVNQVQRDFNGLGQLTKEYQAHSGAVNTGSTTKVQYTYSEMASGANHSRIVSMIYPNTRTIDYNYSSGTDDTISRLSYISQTGVGTIEDLEYLGLSTVVQRERIPNSMKLTYIKQSGESDGETGDKYIGLDRFGRIVDQRWRKGSTDIDRYKYGYDRNSNRLYRDNTLDNNYDELYHADGASNGYDSLDQLVEFQRGALSDSNSDNIPDTVTTASRTQAWTLDAQGNWSTLNTDGTGVNRTHNAQNELTAVGSNNLAYDLNGNMTTDETNKDFVWDAWNRLVEVKDSSDANLISYTYDALGRRVTEDPTGADNTRDLFYSAQWQVVEDWTDNLIANSYVWSPVYIDSLIVRDRNTDGDTPLEERFYPTQDANFNVTALVNGSGVQERYVYDPYGAQTVLDASWNVQGGGSSYVWIIGHQGFRDESLSGLNQVRRREYSSSQGRPVSEDPISFAGGFTNLYVWVGNNPENRLDPTGEKYRATVDYTRKRITIDLSISYYGPGSPPIKEWTDAITNAWGGKCPGPCGEEWSVSINVHWEESKGYWSSSHNNVIEVMPVGWNPIYPQIAGFSAARVYRGLFTDTGEWSAGTSGWGIAHEVGHLFGFGDYYQHDKSTGQTTIQPGYEGTIMAQHGGTAFKAGPDGRSFCSRLVANIIESDRLTQTFLEQHRGRWR